MSQMSEKEVLKKILTACEDAKAIDPVILDMSDLANLTDKFVIASGRSDRHVIGIANRIKSDLRDVKIKPLVMEGMNKAHWVLMDYEQIVVHIFYESARELYDLEGLWSKAKKIKPSTILGKSAQAAA